MRGNGFGERVVAFGIAVVMRESVKETIELLLERYGSKLERRLQAVKHGPVLGPERSSPVGAVARDGSSYEVFDAEL